jgi:ATP/ADP translocase
MPIGNRDMVEAWVRSLQLTIDVPDVHVSMVGAEPIQVILHSHDAAAIRQPQPWIAWLKDHWPGDRREVSLEAQCGEVCLWREVVPVTATVDQWLAGLTSDLDTDRDAAFSIGQPATNGTPAVSGIKAADYQLAWIGLAIIFSLNTLSQRLGEVVSISNFLENVGVNSIFVIWFLDAILLIFATSFQSLLVDRIFRLTLTKLVALAVAILFALCWLLMAIGAPSGLTFTLMFLIAQQQTVFVPVILWTLANDVFDVATARQLFPRLAAVAFMGSLVGSGIAALMPHLKGGLSVETILLGNVGIYLGIILILQVGFKPEWIRKTTTTTLKAADVLQEGFGFIKDVPAFKFLILSLILLYAGDVLMEYYFFATTDAAFPDLDQFQTFFGIFSLLRQVAYLIIQVWVVERLVHALGLQSIWLVAPIATVLAGTSAFGVAGLGGAVLSVTLLKLPLYGVDETVRKTLQGLIPEERRGRVSLFMDGYVIALGSIIGAMMGAGALFLGTRFAFPSQAGLPLLVVGLGLVASYMAVQVRRTYEASMLNWRLKRRQRGRSSILDQFQ